MSKLRKMTNNTNYEQAIKPVRRVLDKALANPNAKSFSYTGFAASAHIIDLEWNFSKEGIAYNEDEGRDVFDLILLAAFNLGYERRKIEDDEDGTKAFLKRLAETREK